MCVPKLTKFAPKSTNFLDVLAHVLGPIEMDFGALGGYVLNPESFPPNAISTYSCGYMGFSLSRLISSPDLSDTNVYEP
jgi:hypothetical protein